MINCWDFFSHGMGHSIARRDSLRGCRQDFCLAGAETVVSLRYETRSDRGIIFFENPALAARIEGAMAPDQDLGGATY